MNPTPAPASLDEVIREILNAAANTDLIADYRMGLNRAAAIVERYAAAQAEIKAMQDESESQQSALNEARDVVRAKDAELMDVRGKLASAYLRLNVIQAALSHPEAA